MVAVDDRVLPEMLREERPGVDLDRMRRVGRRFTAVQGRRHQLTPFVPLRSGVIGAAFRELVEIPIQRAAESHVQDLASTADREQRDATLDREPRVRELDLVQER